MKASPRGRVISRLVIELGTVCDWLGTESTREPHQGMPEVRTELDEYVSSEGGPEGNMIAPVGPVGAQGDSASTRATGGGLRNARQVGNLGFEEWSPFGDP